MDYENVTQMTEMGFIMTQAMNIMDIAQNEI